jgi:hypothetical protein
LKRLRQEQIVPNERKRRHCRIVHRRARAVLFATVFLINCGVVPRDSAGTLDRVRGGELRAGVAHHPPWGRVEGDQATGIEPALIESWAQQLGAYVTCGRAPKPSWSKRSIVESWM